MFKTGLVGVVCALTVGCGDNREPLDAKGDPGALVTTQINSTVGVLLDEIPAAMRNRVATRLLSKPSAFWLQRAKAQLKLTTYRLTFRQFFYGGGTSAKMQLPLPPEEVQRITLKGTARRATVNGHDYVLIDYSMDSVLVTTEGSPKDAEPNLSRVGGTWDEPFIFPIDPELVFQRTRFACMDEEDFPPNSVDSEEVDSFYDHTCGIEQTLSSTACHQTEYVGETCVQALDRKVGRIDTKVTFTRIPWSESVAAQYRFGEITNRNGSDLQLLENEFHEHRVVYRYIEPTSCTITEACVGGPGWRRLLQFSTSDKNTGTKTLDIGPVDYYLSGMNGYLNDWGLFEFSACHQHYHFSHYGDFHYGPEIERKNGFCLQSTQRVMNHEFGPLVNDYGGCDYQGVEASWADQYKAGLECQWVDVTTINTKTSPATYPLSFKSNPDGFLCEGTPILDKNGNPTWEPTEFRTATGDIVYRTACNRYPGWDSNNAHSYDVTLPKDGGSYVTLGCERGQIGPLRNCGFADKNTTLSCTPGAQTTMRCSLNGTNPPQAVRICEYSYALGTGTACTYQDSLNTNVVDGTNVAISFKCPAARDATEVGGKVSLYTAPVFPEDAAANVTCTIP